MTTEQSGERVPTNTKQEYRPKRSSSKPRNFKEYLLNNDYKPRKAV